MGHYNGSPCHIANYYDTSGERIAQKYRMKDKTFRSKGKPTSFFDAAVANPPTNSQLLKGKLIACLLFQIERARCQFARWSYCKNSLRSFRLLAGFGQLS